MAPAVPPPNEILGHPMRWRSGDWVSAGRCGVSGRMFIEGGANFAYVLRVSEVHGSIAEQIWAEC